MNPKRALIHDLQVFLWRFEQGGYTRETMQENLKSLEKVLDTDGKMLGDAIQKHLDLMIQDCKAYANGEGDPQSVVSRLDKLRQDLE